jgi:hypothetical protein
MPDRAVGELAGRGRSRVRFRHEHLRGGSAVRRPADRHHDHVAPERLLRLILVELVIVVGLVLGWLILVDQQHSALADHAVDAGKRHFEFVRLERRGVVDEWT